MLKKTVYLLAEKFAAPFITALIAVSLADQKAALKYRLKPADKIFVIHNGIELTHLNFLPRNQARSQLLTLLPAAAANKKIIFALSDHYPVKGLDVLARAAALIKTRDDFVIVNVRREGPATNSLHKTIKQLGLQNLFFMLSLEQPVSLLKAADIFVLPSLKEGLPYALLYAAAAGLPIVASNTGGIPDVVTHNTSALLCTPGNAEQLAYFIKQLLDNPELCQRLAKAAAEASKNFELTTMLNATAKLYEQLVR
jgi:glycosyltransferase involved in cell wall biosynthesis